MAKYRSIHQKIWTDPDFQDYSANGKLIFIYLCTNASTSESGIYAITPKTISGETGIEKEKVSMLLMKLKNVIFDAKTNYVYIRRFKLYNGGGAPDNIRKAIVSEFLLSSTSPLWNNFVEDYPEYSDAIRATGKPLSLPLPLHPIPVTNSNTNSSSNSSSIEPFIEPLANGSATVDFESKQQLLNGSPTVGQPLQQKKYGQFANVFLTDVEVKKLEEKFAGAYKDKIENLSAWLASSGKKKVNHYATILTWARNDEKDGGNNHAKQSFTPRTNAANQRRTTQHSPEDYERSARENNVN